MAVDLGFAGKSKSCGLAWEIPGNGRQAERVNYGRCIEMVGAFLSENNDSALIVEAPLSALFDASGNPKGRIPFERSVIDGKLSTRYWYVGAGAAVCLGAAFLFSGITNVEMPGANTVNVFEGFISFKTRSSDHVEDAIALLDGLRDPASAEIYNFEPDISGERAVNMLNVTGLVSSEGLCPAVIAVTV